MNGVDEVSSDDSSDARLAATEDASMVQQLCAAAQLIDSCQEDIQAESDNAVLRLQVLFWLMQSECAETSSTAMRTVVC